MKSFWPRVLSVTMALTAIGSAARCQAFNGGAPAATVNGETITVDDWVGRMQNLRYQDFILTPSPFRPKNGTAGQIALEALINGKIIMQYAKKVSLLPPDSEVDKFTEDAKKQTAVANALQAKLITEAALKDEIRLQRALFNVATVNQSVSQAEVQAYFNSHQEVYGQPETWRIGVIRLNGKAAADKAAAELKGGKPFETVAAELSEDPDTKKRGGELGTFAASDPNIPSFIRDAMSKLKVGETTAPVLSTQQGAKELYFILRLLGKREKNMPSLDQVRPMVERAALFEKVGGGAAKVAELRKDAKIDVSLAGYQEMFKK